MAEHQVGDITQGDDYLRRFLEYRGAGVPTSGYSTSLILARISFNNGDEALFDIVQADVLSVISPAPSTPYADFVERCILALLAIQKGDVSLSGELYPALVSQRGTFEIAADLSVDRVLGLLSQTMTDLDLAAGHFEDALAFCRKAGYWPEVAWTCSDYADMLQHRDGDGDQAKAVALLDESLAISSELGMKPLMERVQSRREILNA